MAEYVKCLVWDLDNTLWEGILLEGNQVTVRPDIPTILEELTNRGILNSIASRNEEKFALSMLKQLNLDEYFIVPQINFNPKSDNIRSIAQELNLGLNSLAFIDDSPFEREAVSYSCPTVHVLEAERYNEILDMPEFNPATQTPEARGRLEVYRTESKRKQAKEGFRGTHLDFLKSCQMELLLREAEMTDIQRTVELAIRTTQFNATGIQYGADEIEALMKSSNHRIFTAELSDRFGNFGIIGTMILKLDQLAWIVESFMISCRAAGRGVSAAMLILSMFLAQQTQSKILRVQYRPTDRNRQLGIFFSMSGLKQENNAMQDGMTLWAYNLHEESIPEIPVWLTLTNPIDKLIG
jgi:FkbH-like protein